MISPKISILLFSLTYAVTDIVFIQKIQYLFFVSTKEVSSTSLLFNNTLINNFERYLFNLGYLFSAILAFGVYRKHLPKWRYQAFIAISFISSTAFYILYWDIALYNLTTGNYTALAPIADFLKAIFINGIGLLVTFISLQLFKRYSL